MQNLQKEKHNNTALSLQRLMDHTGAIRLTALDQLRMRALLNTPPLLD